MDINDLTIGQAKELAAMFGGNQSTQGLDDFCIGKYVIIRTYTAGVWAGLLAKKSGNEVILNEARRMWQWCAATGISLSAVAENGIDQNKSRIANPVPLVWLQAIEIIPLSDSAAISVFGAKNAEPQ